MIANSVMFFCVGLLLAIAQKITGVPFGLILEMALLFFALFSLMRGLTSRRREDNIFAVVGIIFLISVMSAIVGYAFGVMLIGGK